MNSPINEKEIMATLTTCFRNVFNDESIIVTPELSTDDIEAWDSLTHIALIEEVQSIFNISFTFREIRSLIDFNNLISLIESKL